MKKYVTPTIAVDEMEMTQLIAVSGSLDGPGGSGGDVREETIPTPASPSDDVWSKEF